MSRDDGSTEFGFELQVCQWAEHHWPPADGRQSRGSDRDDERSNDRVTGRSSGRDIGHSNRRATNQSNERSNEGSNERANERANDRPVIVARQLGTRERRWDTIVVECDPDALAKRAHFGNRALDSDLLHVVRNAPAGWEWYRDALPHPGYPWRYVREAVHTAADRGLVERRRGRNGRIELRRKWPYVDWVDRIVAIENKPDLDASAARTLAAQLERDVALALADEVWVCTRATGESIEPILLADMPVEAGVLTFAEDTRGKRAASVEWQPRTLDVERPGTRILERPAGGEFDASAARFDYVDPGWKADKRLAIAERAYERGWRSYVESMRQDCRYFELQPTTAVARPYCTAKGCHQIPRECSQRCADVEPEPPAWRQSKWPIEGGPGAGIRRLLDKQRERNRPGPPE